MVTPKRKGKRRSTIKVDVFVLEYLKDFNAARAARAAGAPMRSARERGYELLQDPDVQKALNERTARLVEKLEVDVESVLRRYLAIADTRLTDIVTWDGAGVLKLTPSDKLTPDQALALSEVRDVFGSDGREGKAVKLHDKLAALQMLARYVGGRFTDKHQHEHTGKDGKELSPIAAPVIHYHYPGPGRTKGAGDG